MTRRKMPMQRNLIAQRTIASNGQHIKTWCFGLMPGRFFLVEYGFGMYDSNDKLVVWEHMKKRIFNMDETCLSLNSGNGNRGSCPTVTNHGICFPQLGRATSKSTLTTTLVSQSHPTSNSKLQLKWMKQNQFE